MSALGQQGAPVTPMKILFLALEPPVPPNDGGRLRTASLLRQLSKEHEVSLIAFSAHQTVADDLAIFSELCDTIELVPYPIVRRPTLRKRLRLLSLRQPVAIHYHYSHDMVECLKRRIQTGRYEIVHFDQIYLYQYASAVGNLPKLANHHNIEAELQQRQLWHDRQRFRPSWWLKWVEYYLWNAFENRSLGWFDTHCVVSVRDADHIKRQAPGVPVVVVPNGVDTCGIQPRPEPDTSPVLVFVGSLDYQPNVDAISWFIERIWQNIKEAVPDTRFVIVGRNPPPKVMDLVQLQGVTITGTVPSVRPFYEQAHVMVVPLRSGGGTRLKILEAMAAGVPVVSTSVGCEGLDVTCGVDLLTSDSPDAFAERCVQLLRDRDLRTNLAKHARQKVEARYDWQSIAENLVGAYHMAIDAYQERKSART